MLPLRGLNAPFKMLVHCFGCLYFWLFVFGPRLFFLFFLSHTKWSRERAGSSYARQFRDAVLFWLRHLNIAYFYAHTMAHILFLFLLINRLYRLSISLWLCFVRLLLLCCFMKIFCCDDDNDMKWSLPEIGPFYQIESQHTTS